MSFTAIFFFFPPKYRFPLYSSCFLNLSFISSPIIQGSLFIPDICVPCFFFVGVLFIYCWSFSDFSVGVTKWCIRVSSNLCPWHSHSETSVLVLGGTEKNKGSENSSWCHVGWEAHISWSWASLPCPPVCNTWSGHMVSRCLLLGGVLCGECYSVVLLLLR